MLSNTKKQLYYSNKWNRYLYKSLLKKSKRSLLERKKNLKKKYFQYFLYMNITFLEHFFLKGKLLSNLNKYYFFYIFSSHSYNRVYSFNNHNVFYKSLFYIKNKKHYDFNLNRFFLKYKKNIYIRNTFFNIKKKLNTFFFSFNMNTFYNNFNYSYIHKYINVFLNRHFFNVFKRFNSFSTINISNFFIYNNIFPKTFLYNYKYFKYFYNYRYKQMFFIPPNKKKKLNEIHFRGKKTGRFIWFKKYIKLSLRHLKIKDSLKEYNIRNHLNHINLFYFIKFFKRSIFNHILSNLYNSIITIKKKRLLLKQKIIRFFNFKKIFTIIYNNTSKNIFLTFLNYKGNVLFNISSGHMKTIIGRKKTYYYTVFNITKIFLNRIESFLHPGKNGLKIIIKGSLLYVDNFLNCISYYYLRKDNYTLSFFRFKVFMKKYISYIKWSILNRKKNFNLDLLKYIKILWYFLHLTKYYYEYSVKWKKIRILYFRIQKTKSFLKK